MTACGDDSDPGNRLFLRLLGVAQGRDGESSADLAVEVGDSGISVAAAVSSGHGFELQPAVAKAKDVVRETGPDRRVSCSVSIFF